MAIPGVSERLDGSVRVFSVREPNALTQLIGWLKFNSQGGQVVYRGQSRLHQTMYASGLRGSQGAPLKKAGRSVLAATLHRYIASLAGAPCICAEGPFSFGTAHRCHERVGRGVNGPLVGGTYRAAAEPLLQHYGIRTRWLDVVDNVWIALWFACHEQVTTSRHAFHSRRSSEAEEADLSEGTLAEPGRPAFQRHPMAYVAVLDTGMLRTTAVPGYSIGDNTRLVDLRYAVPSVYLRPHAQHGLLIAPAKLADTDDGALTDRVVAYVEILLRDALDWLGTGAMLSPFVLFPPAATDEGFRRLLDYAPSPPRQLGAITVYGPGR